MSDSPKVKLSLEAPIARVVLDRPEKLNALDPEMLGQLEDAVAQVEQSKDIRVIILEATGEKAFCVGADILAWTALSPLGMWSEWVRRGHRIFDRVERAKQPVICAIQGARIRRRFGVSPGVRCAARCRYGPTRDARG